MRAGEKWRPLLRREDTREQITRNIDAEFNTHLEMRIKQLMDEGLSEEDARARAESLLGDAGPAARLCERTDRTWLVRERVGHFLGSIVSDTVYALRIFRTSPLFACMAALCLAVGITFITVTYTILDDTLIHPLPFEDADELVMVGQVDTVPADWNWMWSSHPDFLDWEEQNHVFEHLALFSWSGASITDLDEPVRVSTSEVTIGFADVLKVAPLLGRDFVPADYLPGAEPVALIGHGLWQRAFGGDPAVIGRWITLDGESRHQIVGVMPPHFSFPDFRELWIPFMREEPGPRTMDNFITFGRLRDGVSLDAAGAEMRQIGARLIEEYPENEERGDVRVVPFGPFLFRPLRTPLLVIFIVACLVLLLACSNLANLMLSRTAGRTRELSVRAVLGAGRGRLIQQVMIECLVIALAGGVVGVVLGRLGLNLLLSNMPREVPGFMQFEMNLQVLAALTGIVITAGFIFGLAPALAVRRGALGTALRSDTVRMSSGKRHALFRSSLVGFQITLATVILAVTGLMVRSHLESRTQRLGVDSERLLGQNLGLPEWAYPARESRQAFFREAVERLCNTPGIENAAFISVAPAARNDMRETVCTSESAANSDRPYLVSRLRIVSPGWFATAGIPLLAGRNFTEADLTESRNVALVNESLARLLWGDEDPVGRNFFMSREPDPEWIHDVVGVVGNVRHGGPAEEAGPCFYLPHSLNYTRSGGWLVVRASGDPQALAPVVREVIRDLDPQLATIAPQTIIDLARERNWQTILFAWILGVIAVFALVLALLGIIGVVAYAVTNRRHEFGIRLALGASAGSVVRSILRQGAAMAGTGIAAGMVVALAAVRFLSGMVAGTSTRDPAVYAVIIVILAMTTLLASWLPARRIGIDPVEVLREE